MKKIISAASAAFLAGTVAVLAGAVPNIATPTDPSQIVPILNGMIQSLNGAVPNTGPGVYGVPPGQFNIQAIPTGTGTSAQNLYTWTIPANYMATVKGCGSAALASRLRTRTA